jgi:hypothetical protein
MFFVVHPDQKGKTNKKQIEKIEQFLIQAGAAKNPELQNVEGHIVPNGVFEGLFAAAGKVSVPKPRGRFADFLI